jgi:hypothetical protein
MHVSATSAWMNAGPSTGEYTHRTPNRATNQDTPLAGSHRGSHRAPRPERSTTVPRRALLLAVVVALIPAAWITVDRSLGGDDKPSAHASDKPIPPVSSSPALPPTTATPTPTATPPATPKHRPLPRVAPAVPRRLTAGSILDVGFDDSVEPSGDRFTAGSTAEVARWGSRGEPGSPGTDTVFIVGKVHADGSGAFGRLGSLRTGTKVAVRTDRGTLTYTIRAVTRPAEAGITGTAAFVQKVPGRLILLGIRYDAGGNRLDRYLMVTAELTAARAR